MSNPDLQREPLLSTAAVARWLGVSPRTVCLWAECSVIPAMKIGRQWRFRQADVRRWLERHAVQEIRVSHAAG